MKSLSANSSARWGNWFNGAHIVRFLELVQDLIVISLCIGLFCFMVMQLRELFLSLLPPLNFPDGIDPEQQVSYRHRIRFAQGLNEKDSKLEAQSFQP